MLGILGSVLGGLFSSSAAHSAANAQAQAAAQQEALFKPYQDMGLQGQQAYNSLLGLGKAPDGFTGFQASPGYQWAQQQGMDAAQSSAAARGGLNSGATLRDLNTFGQGLANQEYQTYLNRLQGLGQQGQAAAGFQANAIGGGADARASGIVGGANAINSGINNGIATWGYMKANPTAFPQSNALAGFLGQGLGGFF